ncbi:hypothetical protein BH11ACT6_BH11ACT6_01690 [soil metagenome]
MINDSTEVGGLCRTGLNASVGAVCVEVDSNEVEIELPDRYGLPTRYSFTAADWDAVLDMFLSATRDRSNNIDFRRSTIHH